MGLITETLRRMTGCDAQGKYGAYAAIVLLAFEPEYVYAERVGC